MLGRPPLSGISEMKVQKNLLSVREAAAYTWTSATEDWEPVRVKSAPATPPAAVISAWKESRLEVERLSGTLDETSAFLKKLPMICPTSGFGRLASSRLSNSVKLGSMKVIEMQSRVASSQSGRST